MSERHPENAPPDAPAPRRRGYYVTCALLAVGTLALGYLNWQQMRDANPADAASGGRVGDAGPTAAPAGTVAEPEDANREAGEADPRHWLGLTGGAGESAHAIHRGLGPGYEPLAGEPAGLEPPPAGERTWAFARKVGEAREEVAAWRIHADSLAPLVAFYQAQARAHGLEPVAIEQPDATASVRLLAFTTDEQPPRVLSVRLHQREQDVHALIALR